VVKSVEYNVDSIDENDFAKPTCVIWISKCYQIYFYQRIIIYDLKIKTTSLEKLEVVIIRLNPDARDAAKYSSSVRFIY
jgi:hypothetical protein